MELMVALAISGLILTAVAQLISYSGRSFASLFNYTDLDYYSDRALKLMSREIREANSLTAGTATSLTLNDWDSQPLQYTYDAAAKTLKRIKFGVSSNLLTDCDSLQFYIYQRNTTNSTYDQYPTATPATCKLVQVTWVCSRKVLGAQVNTESVQSAKFVIRKQ